MNFNLKKYPIVLVFIMGVFSSIAQVSHTPVFPGVQGLALLDSVVTRYRTNQLLSYSTCRDSLFSKIDAVNDSLECVYTGMKRFIPPGSDPTDAVLLNGQPNGINTEHAYPQSKGASGYGRSDMHILYPSRVKTNTTRSNNPFGEIPDQQTTTWFQDTKEMSSIPTSGIDLYSESTSSLFEPRESKKGDLARSVFYFFTLYKNDALAADPEYFNIQKEDLCRWHFQDPVDSVEWKRSHLIESYQSNLNPFVLDCSLAARTYCDFIDETCALISNIQSEPDPSEKIHVFPNPGSGNFTLHHPFGYGQYTLELRNVDGSLISRIKGISETDIIDFQHNTDASGLVFIIFSHEKARFPLMIKHILIGN